MRALGICTAERQLRAKVVAKKYKAANPKRNGLAALFIFFTLDRVAGYPFFMTTGALGVGSVSHLLGLARGKIPVVMAIDDDAAGQGRNKKSREYEKHE